MEAVRWNFINVSKAVFLDKMLCLLSPHRAGCSNYPACYGLDQRMKTIEAGRNSLTSA
jgi:hypothetical protein